MKDKVSSFSKAQREYILKRDDYRCQFRWYDGKRWVRCRATTKLQVHHVIPRGFASEHLPPDFDCNDRENLITLCDHHHVCLDNPRGDCAHPDTEEARKQYRSGNKQAFSQMMEDRKKKNQAGIPYWNTVFDWMFGRLIRKANAKHDCECPDEKYPHKRRR